MHSLLDTHLQGPPPGVVVLGMHRSGTSAATRLVALLGPRPPRWEDLVPPSAKNPKGYWESMSLVALNEQLLAALGSDMRWPSRPSAGWEDDTRLDSLRTKARTVFRWTFPTEPWVWKDPRLCLTLTFWRSALKLRPAVVLMNRNPLEIAASTLRAGRGEGHLYLLALWETYLRQALTQISNLPVLVTSYELLLADPVAWCERARGFLANVGLAVAPPTEEDVRAFVDPSLRHVESTRERLLADADVSTSQRELFFLLERMEGPHGRFRTPHLLPETATNDAILGDRKRVLQMQAVPADGTGSGLRGRARRFVRLFS